MTEISTIPITDMPPVYDPPCEATFRDGQVRCENPGAERIRFACVACEAHGTGVLCERCLGYLKAGALRCRFCDFQQPLYLVEVI